MKSEELKKENRGRNPLKVNKSKWENLVGTKKVEKEEVEHIGLKRDRNGAYLNWF